MHFKSKVAFFLGFSLQVKHFGLFQFIHDAPSVRDWRGEGWGLRSCIWDNVTCISGISMNSESRKIKLSLSQAVRGCGSIDPCIVNIGVSGS